MDFFDKWQLMFERIGRKEVEQQATFIGCSYEHARRAKKRSRVPTEATIIQAATKAGLSRQEIGELLLLATEARSKDPEAKAFWQEMLRDAGIDWGDPRSKIRAIGVLENHEHRHPELLSFDGAVKIFDQIQAGHGESGECSGVVVDEIPAFPGIRAGGFGMYVVGDSMDGPTSWLKHGDYALFNRATEVPRGGKICCVCVEGWNSCACKRVFVDPSGLVVLVSDNKDYQPVQIDPLESPVIVKGVFVGSYRKGD
jgi:hypothetical protein